MQLMKNRAWRVQNGRQLCVAATCFASAIFFAGISTNISRMMIYFNAKWNKRSLAVCCDKARAFSLFSRWSRRQNRFLNVKLSLIGKNINFQLYRVSQNWRIRFNGHIP